MKNKYILLCSGLLVAGHCAAADSAAVEPTATTTTVSASEATKEVVVIDTSDDQLTSKDVIDREAIKNTPNGNSNMTDLLKSNPNVRFDHDAENGFEGGEIKPAGVSINGSSSSQTSYMVDGVNVNNDIDPLGNLTLGGTPGVMPGLSSEQAYFFDASMLGSVTVYDSNVPASLGGFTGGAVLAESLNYSGMDNVSLSYKTTNDSWASMQVDSSIEDRYKKATPDGYTAEFQPEYHKQFMNLVVEQGITDELGLVVGVSRRESDIKQNRVINKQGSIDGQDQTRRSDNVMTNFRWQPNMDQKVDLSLRYSSYESGQFWADTVGNNFVDNHLAYGATVRWQQMLKSGSVTVTAAYDKFKDDRRSNSDEVVTTYVDNNDPFILGGYGDSELSQQNSHIMLDYKSKVFYGFGSDHQVTTGLSAQSTQYDFERFSNVRATTIFSGDFEDEMYNDTALQGTVSSNYNNYAFYVDDSISIGNVSLRPGVRVERDDYLKNINVAPRFAASWPALSDTHLTAGANRYHGRSFAAMKLAEGISELSPGNIRRFADIDNFNTPYADELTFGISQNISNLALSVRYVWRENKESLTLRRTDVAGKKLDEYINGEDFHSNIYTLQINNIRPWIVGPTRWNSSFAFDWLDTDRSEIKATLDPYEKVRLDSKLMTRSQMQAAVNSSQEEWGVRLGLDMQIPDYALTWSNKLYVKAPVQGYELVDDSAPISVFKTYEFNTHTQWDTRLRWQPETWKKQNLFLQADLLNVLNETRRFGTEGNSGNDDYGLYSPGRQLWLEVGYNF